ncbi:hypothetical protein TTHERM_01106210 (macronuclear) [Tetrahymena thermophila SB210]|uniref:Uncharacterized protein n=1 Tax=Tetrahymena thermophila (strain SB210) TaxID=312017 RepID=Q22BD6_TETTS|nr:hypothetical protein TTHERM_01106210 [Tetrahymena thermophila SB210]EAR82619.2 hypothetical protein TTHERM_01106210 [Tetrahymena thermophila SB210]|eukprot:XP_001030282.2 hypothetical protein TTHERM_01106210 [Tetrahymena thermophila SB210]
MQIQKLNIGNMNYQAFTDKNIYQTDSKEKNKKQDFQQTELQIVQICSPIVLSNSLLTYGDLLVELNEEKGQLKGFNIIHYLKPTYAVESTSKIISFHIKQESDQTNPNLYQVATILNSQPFSLFRQFAQLLFQFFEYHNHLIIKVEQIINSYQNMEDLNQIIQERRFFITKYLEQIYFSGQNRAQYDLVAWYSYSLQKKTWSLINVIKSKKLIHFLGSNTEQIKRISLKKGRLNMFTLESRVLIQSIYLEFLLKICQSKAINNFQLLTYDGITIECPFEVKKVEINLPSHLQYNFETENDQYELIMHSVYDINSFHEKLVTESRNSDSKYQQLMQSIDEDFEYSMQSEIFMQKFYKESYNKIKENEEKLQSQSDVKTCQYRNIF